MGLGIDQLSMSPVALPRIKKTIRSIKRKQAIEIAKKAMQFKTGDEIKRFCDAKLKAIVPEMIES